MAAPECVSPVDVYVPAKNTWITGITEFPFPRGCQHACLVGDKIYAFGGSRVSGENLTAFDSLHIYDIQSNSWERGQCLPFEMGYFAADTINGKIYVAGGGGSGYSILNSLYVYDPEVDEWTKKASMSTSRWGTFARSWNGKLYVFGGYAGSNWTISRTIEVYDPETDEWTMLTSGLTPRTSGSMYLHDGQLYIIGGYHNPTSTSYNHTKIISRYDIATDTWFDFFHPGDNLPDGRRFSANAMLNDKFYFLGGGGDEDIMDQIWSYSLKGIRQNMKISNTFLSSERIEIDLSEYFSSTGEEELIYSICPGYDEGVIHASIENSMLTIDRLDQAGSTELVVNVYDTEDTISSNAFVVENPVGIQKYGIHMFSVYPNPASETTTIRYNTKEAGTVSLEVFNPLGQLVEKFQLDKMVAGNHQFEWNVEGYRDGLYLIVLKTESSASVGKLMIKH
jgi:N-acetylneuraminic acid mutarotase